MTYHISVIAYDHCYTSGVINILDVLNVANRLWQRDDMTRLPLFRSSVVSPDGEPVETTSGLLLPVHGRVGEIDRPDMVFLPGSDYIDEAWFIELVRDVGGACRPWLQELKRNGVAITACCSGSFIAAECGVLDDGMATTTWWLADLFRSMYPQVPLQVEDLIIDQGSVIVGGAAAYLDMGLYLVEKFADAHVALDCGRMLLIDANRTSQAPYMTLQRQVRHTDDLVLDVQLWLRQHITSTYSLKRLADRFDVSERTLIRRFQQATGKNLTQYVQDLRIETAKRLLEMTNLTLDEITSQVGYVDASSFRRLFKKRTQLTPREYRQRFSVGRG